MTIDQSQPTPVQTTPVEAGAPVWQQPARIVSPSGQVLANWGSRLGAWAIDVLVVYGTFVIVVGGASAIGAAAGLRDGSLGVVVGVTLFIGLLMAVLYAPLTMARKGARNGQTWGKQLVGIRVARDTGAPYGVGAAMLREVLMKFILFNFIGGLFFIGFLNYLWPLWDGQNRAVHDMMAGSHVVKA